MDQIPPSERPRERCLRFGPSCLSLRECLAILVGTGPPQVGCLGLAQQILDRPGSGLTLEAQERAFFNAMESKGDAYLKRIPGLGPAGQSRILASFELGRRYALYRYQKRRSSPDPISEEEIVPLSLQALGQIPDDHRIEPREWLGFIPVYSPAKVGELCIVERGVRTHVNVDPAELFARILALRPSGLFLAHNHPSGSLTPSPQDAHLTRQVYEIALRFRVEVLGHWIVAPHGEKFLVPD